LDPEEFAGVQPAVGRNAGTRGRARVEDVDVEGEIEGVTVAPRRGGDGVLGDGHGTTPEIE